MSCLFLAEISKKQGYIFNSREAQDIVGASIIIRYLTQFKSDSNSKGWEKDLQDVPEHAKLVYSGGGGFCLMFDSREDAINWNKEHSLWIMRGYPGIEYVTVIEDENKQNLQIDKRLQELRKKLADKKNSRDFSFKLYGLGVEKPCEISGMPSAFSEAIENNVKDAKKNNSSKISAEFIAKRKMYDESRDEYYQDLRAEGGFRFPSKDDIKKSKGLPQAIGNSRGENSLIGLIAIDGNKMGKKIKEWFDENPVSDEQDWMQKYHEFTNKIDKNYRTAMKQTVTKIANNLEKLEDSGLSIKADKKIVPIVHIVLSGDDVSFIVDGRIAIDTARNFLDELNSLGAKACAGVAIASANTPYWKLAEAGEELLKNAKKVIARDEQNACVIDWQVFDGDVNAEYLENRYTSKPYIIDETEESVAGGVRITEFDKTLQRVDESELANSAKHEVFNRLEKLQELKKYKDSIKDPTKKANLDDLLNTNLDGLKTLFDALEVEDIYTFVAKGRKNKAGDE